MRLFVAVETGPEVRARAGALIEELKTALPGGRFVRPERIHLTLAFLGEQDEARAREAADALAPAARGGPGPFTAGFAGLGGFPSPARAEVVWLGVREGAAELADLARGVRGALAGFLGAETPPFVPHVTLGRLRRPADLAALAVARGLQDTEGGRCPVRRYVLMRSRLGPDGPHYESLRDYPLAPPAS